MKNVTNVAPMATINARALFVLRSRRPKTSQARYFWCAFSSVTARALLLLLRSLHHKCPPALFVLRPAGVMNPRLRCLCCACGALEPLTRGTLFWGVIYLENVFDIFYSRRSYTFICGVVGVSCRLSVGVLLAVGRSVCYLP